MAQVLTLAGAAMGLFSSFSGGGGDNGAAETARQQQQVAQARQEQVAQENQALQARDSAGLLAPKTGRRALVSGADGGLTDNTLG
jgi:hypothetical protein